jgi:cytochrome c oxidase subunit II
MTGCGVRRPYSILWPAGPQAGHIERLSWLLFIVMGLVYGVTLLLVVWALVARKRNGPVMGTRFVVIAGVVVPMVILVFLLIVDLRVNRRLSVDEFDLEIQVRGRGWWFEVRYPEDGVVDANEIHVPVGKMVRYELLSESMIHSFWVPRLGGKRDQLPDHSNYLKLMADAPGVYHGTCTEYCGGQHARMEFRLVALTSEDFEEWLDRRRKPPPLPTDPDLIHGREVFTRAGCAECHAITGLSEANTGPDLSYLGARRTLAAGQVTNNRANLSGWIADPQSIKPGARMPASYLTPEELHGLVAYLRSLR